MNIKGVSIKNFRCFEEIDLSLESLSILIGENGCGKTAILEALNYAFSSSFIASRISEQDFNNDSDGIIEILVLLDESFIVSLSDGYHSKEIPCNQIYLSIKRREKASPKKALSDPYTITHYVIPDDTINQNGERRWSMPRKGDGPEFTFSERQLSFPIKSDEFPRLFYFNKQRLNQADVGFNTTFDKIATEFNWRFVKNLHKVQEQYSQDWDRIYASIIGSIGKDKYNDTFVAFREKLSKILCQDMQHLELSPLNLKQPFTKSFFSIRDGLNQINFHGLGSGISMLVSLLFIETISQLTGENVIFCIDEPEMHLHPQLQDELFKYLDSLEQQVIYSTHSNHLVQLKNWKSIHRLNVKSESFPNDDILEQFLDFKGKQYTIHEHLLEIEQYYQHKTIFLKENNDLFFARQCILVEGPADKYAIEILADFDLGGTTIITCFGKDKIFYYQMICRAFGIPYFTLFDLDDLAIDKEPNKTIIAASHCFEYYHFNTSLEKDFGITSPNHKASNTMLAIDGVDEVKGEMKEALNKISKFIESCTEV